MKVFQFFSDGHVYAYSGESEEQAKQQFFEEFGEMDIEKTVEIPESKWDDKIIKMYEDNDTEEEPFFVSIREVMVEGHPSLIFTNDYSNF